MGVEVVTKEDLQHFRLQLLSDIRELMMVVDRHCEKDWLKNEEVRRLLKISGSTLQRLRIAGKIKSSKVGGAHYYRYRDIMQLLEMSQSGGHGY